MVQAVTNLQAVNSHQKSIDLDTRNQKKPRYEVTLFTAPVSCFAAQAGISGSNVSCLQRGNDA